MRLSMTQSEQKIAVLKNKPSKQTRLQPLEHGPWTVIPVTCQGWGTNAHLVNRVWNALFLDMTHSEGQQLSLVSVTATQKVY